VNDLVPAFAFRGNREGLGKGLLIKILSIPILGEPVSVSTASSDENEMRKKLFADAGSGAPIVWLDEVKGDFRSNVLNAAITAGTICDRIMATNRTENRRFDAVVFLAGNNYSLSPDLARRIVPINLAYMKEDIDERQYRHPDLE